MRLLIFLGVIYLAYRAVKSWVSQGTTQRSVFEKPAGEIDDVMIKDPFCGIYFPKRDGAHQKLDGEDLYFCSAECRDKYMASRSEQ